MGVIPLNFARHITACQKRTENFFRACRSINNQESNQSKGARRKTAWRLASARLGGQKRERPGGGADPRSQKPIDVKTSGVAGHIRSPSVTPTADEGCW